MVIDTKSLTFKITYALETIMKSKLQNEYKRFWSSIFLLAGLIYALC